MANTLREDIIKEVESNSELSNCRKDDITAFAIQLIEEDNYTVAEAVAIAYEQSIEDETKCFF